MRSVRLEVPRRVHRLAVVAPVLGALLLPEHRPRPHYAGLAHLLEPGEQPVEVGLEGRVVREVLVLVRVVAQPKEAAT